MRRWGLLSFISSCRRASPRAENKSSFTRVSADKFFSKVEFLSCINANADRNMSALWLWSRLLNSASYFRSWNENVLKILQRDHSGWFLTSCSYIRFCFSKFCFVSSIKLSSRRNLLFSPSSCIFFSLQPSEQRVMFAFSSACFRSFFSWFSCDSKYWRFLRSCTWISRILKMEIH